MFHNTDIAYAYASEFSWKTVFLDSTH